MLVEAPLTIVKESSRISPCQELQKAEEYQDIDPLKYVQDEARVRTTFNEKLGIIGRDRLVIRNYDPVLARAMAEQMKVPEERAMFVSHETRQIETALGERLHVAESPAVYLVDQSSKLRSQTFPTEAFEVVVKRGIEHRKKMGSPDTEREEAQLRGILKVQGKMADPDTPLGYKQVFISGRGFATGTTFTHNFVDVYELRENPTTKQRYVEMTRFASDATYEEYKERLGKLRPNFLNEAKGSIDIYFAEHPIDFDPRTDLREVRELVGLLCGARKDIIGQLEYRKVVEDSKPRINYYLEAVCAPLFDPAEVALRLNAILKGAELAWEKFKGFTRQVVERVANFVQQTPVFRSIAEEVNWLGRQVIKQVMAACGMSSGFSIGSASRLGGGSFSGSSSGSSVENRGGSCKECGMPNADNHYHCPDCNHKYADETNRSDKERTKQCGCGFQFGC